MENFLKDTALFHGITKEEIKAMLSCLNAETKEYKKGEYIFYAGDDIHKMGLLLSGKLSIENDDLWGNKTILNMIEPGNVFAETYACVPQEPLMISVVSQALSKVLFLDMSHLLQTCQSNCQFHNKLIQNLVMISAQKNLNLSRRSFYTAAKTIRSRLLSYLSDEAAKHNSCEFDIPFDRQQLADYLNLDRSALSGELSKMKKDGILSFKKNHFVIRNLQIFDSRF